MAPHHLCTLYAATCHYVPHSESRDSRDKHVVQSKLSHLSGSQSDTDYCLRSVSSVLRMQKLAEKKRETMATMGWCKEHILHNILYTDRTD